MTLHFAAARMRGDAAACARLSKTDLNLGFVPRRQRCQGTCPPSSSSRRYRALSAKAGHGALDRRWQRNHAALEKCFDGDAPAATLQLVQKRVRCDERQMCFHDEAFCAA